MDTNAQYKLLSRFYDLFDLIFLLGGKGNPRSGLLAVIGNEPLRVLDVCVGTASSAMLVASHNDKNRVIGIDISPDMLAVARKKIAAKNLPNLEVRRMSADEMSFEDGSFDVAMVSFALHEMEDDLRGRVFQEMARVLKTGGLLCVLDFARQDGLRNKWFMPVWTMLEPACFRSFLAFDWKTGLARYNFQLQTVKEYSFSNLYVMRKAA